MIGTKLAQYEITSHLGTGGMGEVYQATDSKLGRSVAIKLLPEAFTHDADRVARFEREARVLASLNHPNIATIHGVEESGGRKFLVMELVPGETLADRVKRGAIPVREALGIAIQITEALEAAHEKPVIHRDLKPANIKVTPEGKVKVLDFGLAKAFEPQASEPNLSQSPTISMAATMPGVILGTAAYMSPEQAKGKDVDRRTDIFAFGAVLYEMLTGRQAFEGEDLTHILARILEREPDWTLLPANIPAAIPKLLRRCLEKNVKNRHRDAGEVRIDIEEALAEPETVPTSMAAPQRRSVAPWLATVVVTLGLAVLAFVHFREAQVVVPLISSSLNAPEGASSDFGFTEAAGTPELSPDGKWIVFGARTPDNKAPLWIRPLSASTAQILAATDGATFPFWSPESRFVAFFAGGKLKKIDITGGPPIAIADASNGRGGSWSPEGVIVFAPDAEGPLLKISASGGAPSPATSVEGAHVHRFPWFLPDGRHFLLEDRAGGSIDVALRIGSLDSQQTVEIGHASSNGVYSCGHLLFLREDTLMAQPFDPDNRTVQGEAVPVTERVSWVLGAGRKGVFTVSRSGLLAYQTGGSKGKQRLSWFDRTGKVVGALGESGDFSGLELSPDRKSAAVISMDTTGNEDIWIYDIARNLPTHFTFDPTQDRQPVWSRDGSVLVWTNLSGKRTLRRKSTDGNGTEEVLFEDANVPEVTSWSTDGKFLLFDRASSGTGTGVWILPLTPEKPGSPLKPAALVDTTFDEDWGVFSPDGHWVAYQSNESQQQEIYVIPFPGPGGKRQISKAGGVFPRWRPDGKEVFFIGLDGKLMVAEVTLKASGIDVGQVKPLGITVPTVREMPYDVSRDGQRILAITEPERTSSTPLTLIQNWTAILKK